jgi:hypothetical protein
MPFYSSRLKTSLKRTRLDPVLFKGCHVINTIKPNLSKEVSKKWQKKQARKRRK